MTQENNEENNGRKEVRGAIEGLSPDKLAYGIALMMLSVMKIKVKMV